MKITRSEERSASEAPQSPVLMAEMLRNAANPASGETAPKAEERGSAIWRILGGTVLSISAMIAVTLYQQLSSSINEVRGNLANLNTELRKDLSQVSQAQADLVKNGEFSSRLTSVWASIKEAQTLQTAVTAMKERSLVRDQQEKDDAVLRDEFRKDLQRMGAAVAVLKEQAMRREQQDKDEVARRELLKELQRLRERLATLEARQGTTTPVKRAVHTQE